MYVSNLSLTGFRSYDAVDIPLTPGVTVLVGPNGVGKTNVAEAVRYASLLSSHRVAADAPLIRQDAQQAVIRCTVTRGDRQLTLEIAINPGRANRLQVSGSAMRPRDFVGILRTVTFAPEDLVLVKGDPAARRSFIDEVLVQDSPRFHAVKTDYERVVRQRTALLKSLSGRSGSVREAAHSTLGVWDEQLIELGAELTSARLELLQRLRVHVQKAYAQVAHGGRCELHYEARSFKNLETPAIEHILESRQSIADGLKNQIEARRNEELARGLTVVGPHRDDIAMSINELPAKTHASHGECWSLALALRLGSLELFRETADQSGDPVLILDDVFAELDNHRRQALAQWAIGNEQTLVTAAVAEDVPAELAATRLIVTPGQVTAE